MMTMAMKRCFFLLLIHGIQVRSFVFPKPSDTTCFPDPPNQYNYKQLNNALRTAISSTMAAATVFLSPIFLDFSSFADAEIRRPAIQHLVPNVVSNEAWALSEGQMLVDDVWKEVTRQYVDRTFNGMGEEGWRKKRLDAVTKVGTLNVEADEEEAKQVYETIRDMLANLGDPFTRFLTPEQFETLTSYAKGTTTMAGIGVQLSVDPRSGDVMVMNTVSQGPAQTSGILPGDRIVEVGGSSVEGQTAEVVAAKCRGAAGTPVQVKVQRDNVNDATFQEISMDVTRAFVDSNKVVYSTLQTASGEKVGLIVLPSFNQGTESKVREAMTALRQVKTIIIDLRGNVGGYMPAGVDAAKLFLPPQARIVSEIDKNGRATIYINDGVGSDVSRPLYLLVDSRTASASEIFAAALQDNHRATILGTTTFGKGRIQNVQELQFGAGIAVTKAKYITPQGNDIQGVGIQPDLASESACGSKTPAVSCLNAWVAQLP